MNWFRNVKIQNKLFLVFSVLIAMVIVLAVFSTHTMEKVEKSYIQLLEGPQLRAIYASDALSELMATRRYLVCMTFLTENQETINRYNELCRESAERFLRDIDEYYQTLEHDTFLDAGERELRKSKIKGIGELFRNDYQSYMDAIYRTVSSKDFERLPSLFQEVTRLGNEITEKLENLRHIIKNDTDEINAATQTYSNQSKMWVALISFFAVLLMIIVSLLMSNIIKEPIVRIKNAVSEIAKGNLTYPIRSPYSDEIGSLCNHIGDMVDMISVLNKSVSILDSLEDMILVTDFDYNLIYYNRKIAEVYDIGPEPNPNQKCYRSLLGFEEPCSFCKLGGLLERTGGKEEFPSVDWELQAEINGKEMWLACKTSIIRWVDGSLVQICVYKDDTMRKVNEEQRRQYEEDRLKMVERENERIRVSRQSLQTVLDALPIPTRIVDLQSNDIVYVNDSLAELLEYDSPDEVRGLKLGDILPQTAHDGTPSSKIIDLTASAGNRVSFEVDYKTKTGRVIEALLSTRHIEYKGRHSSIGIIKDLTAEKERERILEDAAKREREANQAKSLFLATMSHEIRTPMNGIIGFSELALDDDISQKTRTYLNKIKSSSESLLQIINDILDISKIEAGRIEIEKIPFDVGEVFKLCRTITIPKVLEKGITLFCYAEPSIDRALLGDPTRLRQALLNLLSNAVKFTNTGMVKLLSSIVEKTGNSITVHFEVKDSGIGMSAEQIEHIFKPFEQADMSITRQYGGTGLGLAITKNIIELMGGELKVESALGLGSMFSFDLTFETVNKPSEILDASLLYDMMEKPRFVGEVLICEDNELNQQVISDHLSRVGLKTVIAANGKEGVDYVRRRMEKNLQPFEMIFMDIHMPVMDGLEAAKILCGMGCKTPIIALTANVMSNDKESYHSSGMSECIPKPFSAHNLWECLLKYLKPEGKSIINEMEQSAEDEKQYLMMITSFVKSNQTTFRDINDAVKNDDIKLAHRLAHTLKGVAGAIGVTTLQKAAQAIEQSLAKGKAEFTDEQMSALELELKMAMDEFTPLVVKSKMSQEEDYGSEKALETLDKLDSLLESDSFDSLMMIEELERIPGTVFLIEQLEKFNFKQARETLAVVKDKLVYGHGR